VVSLPGPNPFAGGGGKAEKGRANTPRKIVNQRLENKSQPGRDSEWHDGRRTGEWGVIPPGRIGWLRPGTASKLP